MVKLPVKLPTIPSRKKNVQELVDMLTNLFIIAIIKGTAMPHILIDYSANLEARLDMPGLLAAIRDAAVATGVFPLAGIRVRAIKVDHVLVADGNPDHAYMDVVIRIGAGRDRATKQRAMAAIFAATEACVQPMLASSSLMLSMELREIDEVLSKKTSSIREYLGDLK